MPDSDSLPSIVVLISGGGTNLQALIDACNTGTVTGRIVKVISNRPDAYGLERANRHNIANELIDHSRYANKPDFERALIESIYSATGGSRPGALVLAGFMRVLSADFTRRFKGRIINIHPSLLPAYPGLHTHQRALDNGDKRHGASVHFVTEELDGGPVIVQAGLDIQPGESAQQLADRVLVLEHWIFPLALNWLVSNQLVLSDDGPTLNGERLPKNGLQYHQ